MGLNILGVYAPLSVEHQGVVEHVLTDRGQVEAEESLKTIMAEPSESEDPLLGKFVEERQS